MDNIGEQFQERTKHVRSAMAGRGLDWDRKPLTYKEYPEAKRFPLPPPAARTSSVHEALSNRRSVRRFAPGPMTLADLSYLLWAATGIRESRGGHAFRTAPSAGALYPIETYVAVNSVEGLPQGLYHYGVREHVLEQLRMGPVGEEVSQAALDQDMCSEAPVVLIHSAVFERTVWKYGQRGYRYVYLDAAHVSAQMSLAAASLGLGSCQIAAIYDDEMNALLGADGVRESAIYLSVIGRPAGGE